MEKKVHFRIQMDGLNSHLRLNKSAFRNTYILLFSGIVFPEIHVCRNMNILSLILIRHKLLHFGMAEMYMDPLQIYITIHHILLLVIQIKICNTV